jgi:hypothetical protein
VKNIIAIDIKEKSLSDSQGRRITPDSLESLMDFLMIDAPDTYIVCWNLYQLLAIIKRFIPDKAYQTIIDTDKVWVGGYKIFSSSGKKMSIGHEYREHTVGNFYSSRKLEVDIYNLNRYFTNYKPKDALDIQSKGYELLTALETIGIVNPKGLSSAISMYADTIMSNSSIPHLYDCPEQALEMADYALQMISREWKAVYKIGNFKQATQIDINGCYPSLVKNFGDLSTATIWYGKKYQPCDFGIFKGIVTITGDTPIVDADKQPKVGEYPDMLTTDQWAYLRRYSKGSFQPIDGWMVKFNDTSKPCEKLMLDLYAQRQAGGLISELSKSISNGLIGQFAQHYETLKGDEVIDDKKGNFYNPIYSVMATSRCSLKVGMNLEALGLWERLIYANVDGTICEGQLSLGNGKREFGDFRSELIDALVLSVNHKYIGEKYDDMLLAINKYPNASAYNDVILMSEFNINNRMYDKYPQTGKEWITNVYESKPISHNVT